MRYHSPEVHETARNNISLNDYFTHINRITTNSYQYRKNSSTTEANQVTLSIPLEFRDLEHGFSKKAADQRLQHITCEVLMPILGSVIDLK